MDCFQICPQAEGPQLLHLKRMVWQWELQLGLGDANLSAPAPKISEPQLQQVPLSATRAVSRRQWRQELGKTLSYSVLRM